MNGKTNSSEPRIYSVDEVPHFDIDFKGLIKYAKSIGKTVPELSDPEKNIFITGATVDDVREKALNFFTTEEK